MTEKVTFCPRCKQHTLDPGQQYAPCQECRDELNANVAKYQWFRWFVEWWTGKKI